jgi:hypothetical protein
LTPPLRVCPEELVRVQTAPQAASSPGRQRLMPIVTPGL